jgi:hypothetical protein
METQTQVIIFMCAAVAIFLIGVGISEYKLEHGSLTARKWLHGFTIAAIIVLILSFCLDLNLA